MDHTQPFNRVPQPEQGAGCRGAGGALETGNQMQILHVSINRNGFVPESLSFIYVQLALNCSEVVENWLRRRTVRQLRGAVYAMSRNRNLAEMFLEMFRVLGAYFFPCGVRI